MELDHVFVRASAGAPEADLFCALGLSEGGANTHPGQGTANRRFFFGNAFIELLWIANEDEIASAATRRTQLEERLDGAAADVSPFGLCFRPSRERTAPHSLAGITRRPICRPACGSRSRSTPRWWSRCGSSCIWRRGRMPRLVQGASRSTTRSG